LPVYGRKTVIRGVIGVTIVSMIPIISIVPKERRCIPGIVPTTIPRISIAVKRIIEMIIERIIAPIVPVGMMPSEVIVSIRIIMVEIFYPIRIFLINGIVSFTQVILIMSLFPDNRIPIEFVVNISLLKRCGTSCKRYDYYNQ